MKITWLIYFYEIYCFVMLEIIKKYFSEIFQAGMLFFLLTLANAQPQSTSTEEQLPVGVDKFYIQTNSESNKVVSFYLRVPKSYRAEETKKNRILVLCPVVNASTAKVIREIDAWQEIADQHQWFLLSFKFGLSKEKANDRTQSYYYPETYSGKAMLDAFSTIEKKYSVDTRNVMVYGLSGGAQFAHRFAIWAPERVIAVAVNSSSWFDEPKESSRKIAWLITVGEDDDAYERSLVMVNKLKELGIAPVFRSYTGMGHERNESATPLNKAFLEYYDKLTRSELGKNQENPIADTGKTVQQANVMPLVGDSQILKYTKNTEELRDEIPEEFRIYLPNEEIARWWAQETE